MKKKTTPLGKLLLVLGLVAGSVMVPISDNQAQNTQTRYRFFIDVPTKSKQQLRSMSGWLNQNGFDVAGVNLKAGKIEVITTDEGVARLRSKGMNGSAMAVTVAGGKFSEAVDPRFYNPQKIEAKLKELNNKFQNVTSVVEIGKSIQGRSILALVISTTPNLNDPKFHSKPTVMFDAMHHAREVMTPEVVMDIAESMLAQASKGPGRAREALSAMNLVLIPMVNVDGNNIVWTQDNMWRKNAHKEGSSTFGVDINRNYPYKYAACNGSSGNKGAQDYHGDSAASEPETKALMAISEKVRPVGVISYHSYSELVLYPFGCKGDHSGEHEALAKLGKEMAEKLPSDSGGGTYEPGTPWEILYAVDGDSIGYQHAAFGALTYVFEINQSFQPSYSLRDPTVAKHRAAWHHFLDRLSQNMLTVQVRDAQGNPVQAAMTITQIPHVKGERDFGTNPAGNFFKMLLPGNYSIETKGKNGKRAVVQVNMTGQPQTVTITL